MVNEDSKKLFEAIHALIIEARIMTGNKTNHEDIFDFLDHLEYLPALVIESNDRTNFFEQYLLGICQEYNCMRIYNKYRDIKP